MDYVSAEQIANEWGVSSRRVTVLCSESRIPGARKLGKVWLIPSDAPKPLDNRVRRDAAPLDEKQARSAAKRLASSLFEELRRGACDEDTARRLALSALSSAYLEALAGTRLAPACARSFCSRVFGCDVGEAPFGMPEVDEFRDAVSRSLYPYDMLSWACQYVSRLCVSSQYKDTQFFTEKYMVGELLAQVAPEPGDKVLDPACGGGNFLIGAAESVRGAHSDFVLENLWGYDIDPGLAKCAAVTLLAYSIGRGGGEIGPGDLEGAVVNIYHPKGESLLGALEKDMDTVIVNALSGEESTLGDLWSGADHVVTNPPFKTMKGMDKSLRDSLKAAYPLAKADMCNCFILQILEKLRPGADCALVTQVSWMHLSSYKEMRASVAACSSARYVSELGSGAFRDLSGEKANVALVALEKNKSPGNFEDHDSVAEPPAQFSPSLFIPQLEPKSSVSLLLGSVSRRYSDHAVPMQGTSTGDSRNLIGHFWRHFGDPDWIPVSKGGGYCRWYGLNQYSLKWGRDGEYIKATPGSALRNVKYFGQTDFVFSDTGTAGLNVRTLLPGQVFVASGPGIRSDSKTCLMSQLAFLNSRLATYCVRKASPKLTIAAGYIGDIPTASGVVGDAELERLGRECLDLKAGRFKVVPTDLAFDPALPRSGAEDILDAAFGLMLEHVRSQVRQLLCEMEVNRRVYSLYGFSEAEISEVDGVIGDDYSFKYGARDVSVLDSALADATRADGQSRKTCVRKGLTGCDSPAEYACRLLDIDPGAVLGAVETRPGNFRKTLAVYKDLLMHNLVISSLGYSSSGLAKDSPSAISDLPSSLWAFCRDRFNLVHEAVFLKDPVFTFNPGAGRFEVR